MISVVMPVYNAKKYIALTLDSIVNQTYKDFELIIIDDGATDGTDLICKEYSKNYNNVYYYSQENQGCCAARNYGISIARGEYIAFSDHDDIYDRKYLETMHQFLIENNVDFVKCGVEFINEYETSTEKTICAFTEKCMNQSELITQLLFFSAAYYGVWNCVFKTSFLKSSGVQFDTGMKYGQEDFMFNIELVPHIKKVGFVKKCLYKHYKRLKQSTSAQFHPERIRDIKTYAIKEVRVLEKYSELLPYGWRTIVLSQNLVGIIRYCKRGGLSYDNTCPYIESYVDEMAIRLKKIQMIRGNGIKYSLVLFLARKKLYRLLYMMCNTSGS